MTKALRVLHLNLHLCWFEKILSGEKREEYRELSDYWRVRLEGKQFDVVEFRNDYKKNAPRFRIEFKEIIIGLGVIEWGAPATQPVYIIRLASSSHATHRHNSQARICRFLIET